MLSGKDNTALLIINNYYQRISQRNIAVHTLDQHIVIVSPVNYHTLDLYDKFNSSDRQKHRKPREEKPEWLLLIRKS